MLGNALPFVGNFYMYLIVFANIFQIILYRSNIKYKYMPFGDFQFKHKYHVGRPGVHLLVSQRWAECGLWSAIISASKYSR